MSEDLDRAGDMAPGPDDVATQSMSQAGEQLAGPSSEATRGSSQGGGYDAETGDGCITSVLAPRALSAPTYRRSLFRR